MLLRKSLIAILGIVSMIPTYSQVSDTTSSSSNLPFYIDPSKRMPDFELAEKKEGFFITGLPRFEFDPIRGFGVGGNMFLFWNNKKEDPFFEYTAYRHRLNAEFFIFQNGRVRYAFNYDAPYIFNSKWRLRADAVLWEDPTAQYWGIGSTTNRSLTFRDKRTGIVRNYNRVKDYETNLALAEKQADGSYTTDFHYHHMQQREQLYNILGERVMMGGKLRFMFGYELLFTSFNSYNGVAAEEAYDFGGTKVDATNNQTLLDKQKADGTWARFNLGGFSNSDAYYRTSMLAAALIYDTRDFEPDPSKGVFLQYSHEYSSPALASQFDFHKYMVQAQYITTPLQWRNNKSRITFAGLAAFGHIFGNNINFIEMWDLSSQAEAGGILVLGGSRSVRGYREARFLAPTVALVNLEMRTRFYDFKLLNQHIALGVTPFYDFGNVWDSPSNVNFQQWIGAPGIGGRVAWNQSTILRMDYAQSREGGQFFFGFSHIF